MEPRPDRLRAAWVALGVAALAVATFARAGGNGFVDLDDGAYVYANEHVTDGLTRRSLAWAFATAHSANWHPLTWLSHMLDVELFGLDPSGHHWTSVLLHAANASLLFGVLRAASGATWRSAFAAALFAVHPLRVESVAWVAERKDVLSATFGLLALWAYVRYARRPSRGAYFAVVASFALSLMAKPMLVTLPFALLVADAWPLSRLDRHSLSARLLEKLPLAALSAASCAVTLAAQAASAATGSRADYPLGERAANALVSYVRYLADTLWPASLAAFYPHPSSVGDSVSPLVAAGAAALLAAISWLVFRERARRPWLAFGWAWYLGTLVPVIGLVQVGSQARADRYTYWPSIGVFVAAAWGAGELLDRLRWSFRARAALALAPVLLLALVANGQIAHWRDGESLYRRALAVTDQNWLAWNNLGNQHLARGELADALRCFEAAQRIFPGYSDAWYNAGLVHLRTMDRARARTSFERAVELDPSNLDAWNGLGVVHLNEARLAQALECFDTVLRRDARHADALENAAIAHSLRGDRERFDDFERRLRAIDPSRADALVAAYGRRR